MTVPLPSLRAMWVSLFSDESILRPRYEGTGSVYLDSSLGGYHVFTITPGDRWIIDTRCFWASDGEVNLRVHRESLTTAFFAGEGLLWYKTALSGDGQVVLTVDGPVEEVSLENDRLLVDGPLCGSPYRRDPTADAAAGQVVLERLAGRPGPVLLL